MAEEKKTEIPENLKEIVETIEEMKVKDLAKLVNVLEEKFDISPVPAGTVAPQPAQPEEEEQEEEKSAYDVVLTDIGDKKISVIKAVKKVTDKGLKDCKDLVDAVATEPQTVRENVETEEAEEMKKRLVEAGAKAKLE